MKLVLCVGVFAAFSVTGYVIWHRYKQRKIFFENLLSFCAHLTVEISFSKNTVANVIETYKSGYGAAFRAVLCRYFDLVIQKQDITRERVAGIMWQRLRDHEKSIITDFFYELGRHGSIEERQKIENKKIQFDGFFTTASDAMRTSASIYLKIFILLGLGAAILIV